MNESPPPEGDSAPRPVPALGWTAAGLIGLVMLWTFGERFMNGFIADFGPNLLLPAPRYAQFLAAYATVGLAMAICLAAGLAGLVSRRDRAARLRSAWNRVTDRHWVAGWAALAVALPLGVHHFLLEGAPLVDDEKAYRFMADVLLRGQVTAETPRPAEFFDRFPMINTERYYAQYFLGWPALLAPAAAVGLPEWANPIANGALVVAIFAISRRLYGSTWAKLSVVLLVVSPFALFLAGTLSSHPSCAALIAWAFWFFLRSRDADAPARSHAGLALCISAAFFNRPTTTLGLGLPILFAWAADRWHQFENGRLSPGDLGAFGLPTTLLAAAFFAVNWAQNGSPVAVSYQAFVDYSHHLGLHFEGVSNFDFIHVSEGPARTAIALVRLHVASWGWPMLLPIPLLAGADEDVVRLLWWSVGSFLAVHFFLTESGVDLIGPVHFFELLVPLTLLTTGGLRRATQWFAELDDHSAFARHRLVPAALPLSFAAASVFTSTSLYMPMRAKNLRLVAERIDAPRRAVERRLRPDERAVVFAPVPWVKCERPPGNVSLWPPFNSPGFDDRVVWANHLTVRKDRQFAHDHYPDRTALIVRWDRDACRARARRLEAIDAGAVEPGRLEGLDRDDRSGGTAR